MMHLRSMSRNFTILPALCTMIFFAACGEKSEAEKADEERAVLRDEKRKRAADDYRAIAEQYPDDPKAAEAKQKAAALDAKGKKK